MDNDTAKPQRSSVAVLVVVLANPIGTIQSSRSTWLPPDPVPSRAMTCSLGVVASAHRLASEPRQADQVFFVLPHRS